MSLLSILWLAVGLSMDAAAASATRGLAVPRLRVSHALWVALAFGGAQALMPLLGYLLGSVVGPWVEAWDHWIAFALLTGLGGKMLWEARGTDDDEKPPGEPFAWRTMLLLALATSIDAFAVGITLPMLNAPLWQSLAIIGVTTALLSVAGLFAGRHFGALLGKRLDAFGGAVLVVLGGKILLEHLAG